VSGNFNVTSGDISARRMVGWDKNTMIASVPVEKIQGIADAIDKSTAGTAKPSSQFINMTERMMTGKK
jgi:translation elongation factor EF-G